jgi:endonuclease/exonuclease/phosphatase family metal-dependent hydrolase
VRRVLIASCTVGSLGLAACDLGTDAVPTDAGSTTDASRGPNDNIVPPVGTDQTLDIACWNLEWFPKDERTASLVVDLITSMKLDIVVVEEIASVVAWNEVVERLPLHEAVLSSHRYSETEYQKIGIIYRSDLVTAGEPELLFSGQTYAFPRPALKLHVTAGSLTVDLIGVHLKAGVSEEDGDRRAAAMRSLDSYVRTQVDAGGEDEVIILGDFNETVDTSWGMAVMAPMLAAPERYRFRSQEAALAGEASYIPSGRVIDHVVTTAGLADEVGGARAVIPRLDQQLVRYESYVSDHLPVVLSIPMP